MDKNIDRINVKLDDFLLWHNNPRLIEEFGEERPIEAVEAAQEEISDRLRSEAEVRELVKSILSNGWLGYDTILVAEHQGKEGKKYVVLEGNRRITSLKIIVENARKGFKNVQGYDNDYHLGLGIHEMGTARMGRDPKTSVLNGNNQLHEVPNVFVTDGACMTSAGNVNPSLTYMALTARAVNFAVEELKKNNI